MITTHIVKGRKFRIIANLGGHNYPPDRVMTFKRNFPAGGGLGNDMAVEMMGNSLSMRECEFASATRLSLQEERLDLVNRKNALTKQVEDLEKKINYCEANNTEEFDESAFRVSEVLIALEDGTSNFDKAKKIAELLNA